MILSPIIKWSYWYIIIAINEYDGVGTWVGVALMLHWWRMLISPLFFKKNFPHCLIWASHHNWGHQFKSLLKVLVPAQGAGPHEMICTCKRERIGCLPKDQIVSRGVKIRYSIAVLSLHSHQYQSLLVNDASFTFYFVIVLFCNSHSHLLWS